MKSEAGDFWRYTQAMDKALKFVEEVFYEEFSEDDKTVLAVV